MKKKENRFRQLTLSGRSADCVEHYIKKRSFLIFFVLPFLSQCYHVVFAVMGGGDGLLRSRTHSRA